MIMLILAFIVIIALFIILTYPSKGNVNKLTLFIKNVCLLGILYINICLAYAILSPLLQANYSGVLDSINNFFNSFIANPFTKVFGISLDSIINAVTFLPNYIGEYFYRELSINENTISVEILIISVSIAVLSIIDIITKFLFVDKDTSDINHRFLFILNYTLTIITGIAVLLSVFILLPYYYELSEIIVITPDNNVF